MINLSFRNSLTIIGLIKEYSSVNIVGIPFVVVH